MTSWQCKTIHGKLNKKLFFQLDGMFVDLLKDYVSTNNTEKEQQWKKLRETKMAQRTFDAFYSLEDCATFYYLLERDKIVGSKIINRLKDREHCRQYEMKGGKNERN